MRWGAIRVAPDQREDGATRQRIVTETQIQDKPSSYHQGEHLSAYKVHLFEKKKKREFFKNGGTLNWSKMVKMVKMVGILGAFLGEKKGEGSWVQS